MISRQGKILVALSNTPDKRMNLLADVMCSAGFARTRGDAKKIVKRSIHDLNLDEVFFVAACYNFENHHISQKLIKMALQGIPVLIGASKVPNWALQFCQIYEA